MLTAENKKQSEAIQIANGDAQKFEEREVKLREQPNKNLQIQLKLFEAMLK